MFAKFFKFLGILLVIILVAVLIAAGALFVAYQMYLAPKPAEFEFSQAVESMEKVEVVEVTGISTGSPKYSTIAEISDVEGFLAEFNKLECTKGLPLSIIGELKEISSLTGVKITYKDGSFDVITSYGNINSEIFADISSPADLLTSDLTSKEFFFFDKAEFASLIEKYR